MTEIKLDTTPKHEISPYLYMQFMEPLGTADASVDAAWDYVEGNWQEAVIEKTRELAPAMIRFGGCFASYYHWREGVGRERKPMNNLLWGGQYSNSVGTAEVCDFCKRVGAEPLFVVNTESDGRMHWAYPKNGECRLGTSTEAAEWVDFCNNPDSAERISAGEPEPYNVKYWQIGNETSYDTRGYSSDKALEVTSRFAAEMLGRDSSIKLIGWGDSAFGENGDKSWCRKMSTVDELDMIAFHHHTFIEEMTENSPLDGRNYRETPDRVWEDMTNSHKGLSEHIDFMRSECGKKHLAMTEGHFAFPGLYRNTVLATWNAGAAYARWHNVFMRNSDILDIATMADFCGNTWQVNAMMIPTPMQNGKPYLQPVGAVMKLFREYTGKRALEANVRGSVDATASIDGDKIYLHIVNTSASSYEDAKIDVPGKRVTRLVKHGITAPLCEEISFLNPDIFSQVHSETDGDTVRLAPAEVCAVEVVLCGREK